jgi:predicted O-linked N-acetylglucosamine transferase (SPINDLY family)
MQKVFDLAVQHQQAGRLAEAQELCRQMLAANPADANVLHLLGMVESRLGDLDVAISLLENARRLQPTNPFLLNTLGSTYGMLGQHKEAEKCLRKALSLKPDLAEAHSNLGNALTGLGEFKEAERSLRRAVALDPRHVDSRINLGAILRKLGRPQDAEKCYREAIALNPDLALAHSNLGNALGDLGRLEDARQSFERALVLKPDFTDAQLCLANILLKMGQLADAERCYRGTLAQKPDSADAKTGLGNALMQMGKVEEAEHCYREALVLDPASPDAHWALLFALNHNLSRTPAEIFAEHLAFAQRFYRPASIRPHGNNRDPGRKLRIGYVSGDLRDHPVGHFIAPVLAHHDPGGFQIFCYDNLPKPDDVKARLKRYAHRWREVLFLTDEALVDQIRRDAIDVLVDLSGHTGNSRLHAFAHKPAPVQVTWLGYLNTSGMPEMDYRITDAHASPEGMLDEYHTEQLVRLPDSQWCFEAPADCPPVAALPSIGAGHVTFASFSSLARIGPAVIELWSRLLARVPDARLLVVRRGLISIRDEFRARFARHGVAPERIEVRDALPFREYLALQGSTDIVLDTFPYTGGTTTCHSLWMGVPLVTLTGNTATSRGGASLMSAIGLGELVAHTAEEYLDIATALAQDRPRLTALRAGMRDRMAASPLMDAERFTRNLEKAYRAMWATWCKGTQTSRGAGTALVDKGLDAK